MRRTAWDVLPHGVLFWYSSPTWDSFHSYQSTHWDHSGSYRESWSAELWVSDRIAPSTESVCIRASGVVSMVQMHGEQVTQPVLQHRCGGASNTDVAAGGEQLINR